MGGAIFVMDGGSLIARGAFTATGNIVTAGAPSGSGTGGSAFGAGLFLNGNGAVRFSPAIGKTEHVLDAIDDEAGVVAKGYTPPGGFIPGSYNLIKSGLGTLVLSADNAYSGATTVKAGKLIVSGSIAHSATTVDANATLAGNGTTGNVTVLGGGFLSPGPGTAILHSGSVVLDPHAHFAIQLGGANPGPHGSDQLDVTGTVNLGGAKLDLALLASLRPYKGETFEIISNGGTDAIVGHFAGLAEGAHFAAGGKKFSISYHAGDGNDVVLTELGHATTHALHHPSVLSTGDLWFE
jgi:autotransporter-associated beta strand protein